MKHLFLLLLTIPTILTAQPPVSIRTLTPYPKVAFEREGTFNPSAEVVIVSADSAAVSGTIGLLRAMMAELLGGAPPPVITPDMYDGIAPAIFIDLVDAAGMRAKLIGIERAGEYYIDQVGSAETRREAYILDVDANAIVIAGLDDAGTRHAVATLGQLVGSSGPILAIAGAHILDWPDYPNRWLFSQHNLRGTNAMTVLKGLMDQMTAAKMNGIQQGDFKYSILDEQPDFYFDSVARFKAMADERGIAIIPGVAPFGWSSGILWHDPNLAEGFPAEAEYVMENGVGEIVVDPRVAIPNGGFENVGGNGKLSGWGFYDEENVTIDRAIYRSGSASARSENFTAQPAGNSRFNVHVDCLPNRAYTMSAYVRTEDLDVDDVRLLAIGTDGQGKSRSLTYTAFAIPATTNGWIRVEARFNTLEFTQMNLYCGVWGGRGGAIWWDDFEIRDAGMLNILRREGTPLHVVDAESGREYVEGVDFHPIVDSIMLASGGEFGPYHTPPTIRSIPGGALADGRTVRASWHHPLTTVADQNVNGSVMACVSDEKTYDIVEESLLGVQDLYDPEWWFMSHDEIRAFNRDSACLEHGGDAADLLAENITRVASMIDTAHPDARVAVWSDMLDSLHNAHADYYLINGDLTGVWNDVPKDITIVNWNDGNKEESLEFFERHGFAQIAAPFLPSGASRSIREWRLALEEVPRARGMMYTTWSNNYAQLRPFGHYSWSAGPYLMHAPFTDSSMRIATEGAVDSVRFDAEVFPDPFDVGDVIASVEVRVYTAEQSIELGRYPLTLGDGETWSGNVPSEVLTLPIYYIIVAHNTQGLVRETPPYYLDVRLVDVPHEGEKGVRLDLTGR